MSSLDTFSIVLVLGILAIVLVSVRYLYLNYRRNNKKQIENTQTAVSASPAETASSAEQVNEIEIEKEISTKKSELDILRKQIKDQTETLRDLTRSVKDVKNKTEKEIEVLVEQGKRKKEKIQKEIDSLFSQKQAIIEANLRELEVKDKWQFYSVQTSAEEENDIKILSEIRPQLHSPIVLSKYIWSAYYLNAMNKLCGRVLPDKAKITGVYKITLRTTDQVYIGQAVDVKERWRTHVKTILGAEGTGNAYFYKIVRSYKISDLCFELLEECTKDELNEKEKYYISLYRSDKSGLNQKGS